MYSVDLESLYKGYSALKYSVLRLGERALQVELGKKAAKSNNTNINRAR